MQSNTTFLLLVIFYYAFVKLITFFFAMPLCQVFNLPYGNLETIV